MSPQEQRVFKTPEKVAHFMDTYLDHPCDTEEAAISPGITRTSHAIDLGNTQFTNAHRISIKPASLDMDVRVSPKPVGVNEVLGRHERLAASAGFFFLADQASQVPKQAALHGAIAEHLIYGLPLQNRELLELHGNNTVSARVAQAVGTLSIAGQELVWAGSLSAHDHEVSVFGSGNARIVHQETDHGIIRVLEEESKFTGKLKKSNLADVGCVRNPHTGAFTISHVRSAGKMNIFDHDLTLRVPATLARRGAEVTIDTLDGTPLTELRAAVTTGPALLGTESFAEHPINGDTSLGTMPPFIHRRMARMAIFGTSDGLTHLQLFDARPGSKRFVGVTPDEAKAAITSEFNNLAWGCFLDPGQTARLAIRDGKQLQTYGNRHYLDKPTSLPGPHTWQPHIGRPTASALVVR